MIITCNQYKYVVKEKKTSTFITDDTEISDSERENLDEENSNEKN